MPVKKPAGFLQELIMTDAPLHPEVEKAIAEGFIYMTPALIINGFLMAHNVVDSLTDSRQNVVVGSTA